MSDATMVPSAESPAGLSQLQRLINTFVAPSKTFEDIRRSSSWWLPWLIAVVIGLGFTMAVQQKVGWDQAYDNILHQNPKAMQRMDQMQPAQAAQAKVLSAKVTQISSYSVPVLGLIIAAIIAGVLMATVNFGFGGKATFGQMFAVWYYATLPLVLMYLLSIITLYAGLDPTTFNLSNPIGTNIGYYLPSSSPHWMVVLGNTIDIFSIWTAVLLTIGCAAVGRIKTSSAAIAVFGWWILITVIKVGAAAIM